MIQYRYIAIEGNIGSGKTSLAQIISEKYNGKLILERFEDNSFLPRFYEDPERYAFPLEMSFLADRYQQLKEQLPQGDLFTQFTISDYIIDKSFIFAGNNLNRDELTLYKRLFDIISAQLPRPDLIIYLYKSVELLQKNIKKRGRPYEQNIQDQYLANIQERYLSYFNTNRLPRIVIVDTENLDFVNRAEDLAKLLPLFEQQFPPGIHRIIF
ncbi:MAG: hypothetical protein Kow00127_01980 [Bacteroidales bacterium]